MLTILDRPRDTTRHLRSRLAVSCGGLREGACDIPSAPQRDHAKFWVAEDLGGLELMRATFVSHRFAKHSHETCSSVSPAKSGTILNSSFSAFPGNFASSPA